MSAVRLVQTITPTSIGRFVAGSTITLQLAVYVDDVLTDESAIAFLWKSARDGVETAVTPTHAGTGLYTVSLTPLTGGDLYYRWDTEGTLDMAQEGRLSIKESAFTL